MLGGSLQMRHWIDCIGLIVSAVLSDRIGWILLAGSYWFDGIGISLGFARRNWILYAGWFGTGWMVRMDWMGRYWDATMGIIRSLLPQHQG